jgi:hypothetical protein
MDYWYSIWFRVLWHCFWHYINVRFPVRLSPQSTIKQFGMLIEHSFEVIFLLCI